MPAGAKNGIYDEHSKVHLRSAAPFRVLTAPSRPCCAARPVGAHVDASEGGQECQHPGHRHRGRGKHPPAIAADRHHPGECEGQEVNSITKYSKRDNNSLEKGLFL